MDLEKTLDAFGLVVALFVTSLASILTLLAISEWNVRLTSWTDMQMFTLRATMVIGVVFGWAATIIVWRLILSTRKTS